MDDFLFLGRGAQHNKCVGINDFPCSVLPLGHHPSTMFILVE